jgi:hypothetical protein
MKTEKTQIEQIDMSEVAFKNDKTMYIDEAIKSKSQKVYMAMLMGNHNCDNVRILFNTEDGEREVSSRIWALTDKYIVLKGGMFIPIEAVIDIILDEAEASLQY